jgi:transposase InsO family protein
VTSLPARDHGRQDDSHNDWTEQTGSGHESFNAPLKRELLEDGAAFPDQAIAYRAVFRWANRYNIRRRHSAIGHVSPNTYETAYEAVGSATLAEAA